MTSSISATRVLPGIAVPDTMTAWRIAAFGPPEVLTQLRVPVPVPAGDSVLVEVSYCGVCRHDLLTRAGAFPTIPLPMTLGHQVSGIIVATGPDAVERLGDRVISTIFLGCGHCPACTAGNQAACLTGRSQFMGDDLDGGYAEYVCAPQRAFTRVPDNVPLQVAAVVSCTLGTAFHALKARAEIRAGQTVVITGASGGIGVHAIPLARLLGARVIAITSRSDQVATLTEHGANDVIVAPDLKFARRVKELTAGIGADAVIEIVGEPTLAQSLHAVRTGGRVVVLGNVEGGVAEVRPAHLIMKEIALVGTKSCTDQELAEVFDLVASGRVGVNITELRPLAAALDVHRAMESRSGNGRTVLIVSGRDPAGPAPTTEGVQP